MGTNPPIEDLPEDGKVIEFRIPENWVPLKFRAIGSDAKAPQVKSASGKASNGRPPEAEPPGDLAESITKADLEELEQLREAYREARQALVQKQDWIAWHLLHDATVQPGPRSARLRVCNRPPKTIRGASYYRLEGR